MPKPKDRVQLTKQESNLGGGTPTDDSDFLNDFPLDSGQDAPDLAGIYIQESGVTKDKTVVIYREDSEMWFEDILHSGLAGRVNLDDLTGSGVLGSDIKFKISSDDSVANFAEDKIVAGSGVVLTTLNPAGNEQLEINVPNVVDIFTHRTLRDLIHFIDEGPACGFVSGATKTVTGGIFPTLIEWKTSSGDLIVKKEIERSAGFATNIQPTPITWTMYDIDGTTVLCTIQDDISYTGVTESSRTRTIA